MINHFPPVDKGYTYLQTNRGDDIGSMWSSMNLDFQSNYGVLRVSPRLLLGASVATDASFTLPMAIKEFDTALWALAGTKIYKNATTEPNESWAADASSGAVTTYDDDESDMETFDGRLWASNDAGLYAKVSNGSGSGAWSLITATPNAGLLQYFRKFNRLYISEATSQITSISDADVYASTDDYTITLPVQFSVMCMCETADSIWIGTANTQELSGRGSVFRWDGISAQATERYYLEGNEILSLQTKNDIPYAVDSNGILYEFTGSSFSEIGRFPFIKTMPGGVSTSVSNARFIHRHGMVATKDDTLLLNISSKYEDLNNTTPENCPSGIWEWSKDFGLVHKYSVGYTPRETTTITDYGQYATWRPGALANINIGNDSGDKNGSLLCGAQYYTDATTGNPTNFGLFYDDYNDLIQKKGYFVTTWFNSDEIQDQWQRLWTVYRKFSSSDSSIVMKYRTTDAEPVYADITWVNTTSFTTTTDITGYGPTATGFNGTIGGEVEFTQGTGSGACVHITNIVNNAGTYTVTIDTAVTGVTTGAGRARFQKWIKLNPAETQNQVKEFSSMGIDTFSPSIQIKGCLTFTGPDEFKKMALVSNEDIKITS